MTLAALVASTFVSFSALAAIEARDMNEIMGREVRFDPSSRSDKQLDLLSSKAMSVAKVGGLKSSAVAALNVQLDVPDQGRVSLASIVDVLVKSNDVLNDSTKLGNDLKPEAAAKKANMLSAIQGLTDAALVIAPRINDMNSDNAKVLAKILFIGTSIAKGEFSSEQMKGYEEVARGVADTLREAPRSAKMTAEQALVQTLDRLYPGKTAQKLQELLGCKV